MSQQRKVWERDTPLFAVMMLRSLFLILLAASASCLWLDGDDGVDRRNGDLPNMPVALNLSAQPSDCGRLCLATHQCVAWAYGKPQCSGAGQQPMCWLKGAVTTQSYNLCRVC